MDIVTGVELECSYGAGDGRTRSGVASMPKERSGGPRLDRSCNWEKYGYDMSKEYGGTVVQAVVPAYQRCLQDTPLPLSANPFAAPEEGQVRGQVGEENTLVYPENPQVHWPFHGPYILPSAKLHMYSTPHA